ncbi:MAG TPA: hypothetical protein VF518_17130 [Polyangia bacterium]
MATVLADSGKFANRNATAVDCRGRGRRQIPGHGHDYVYVHDLPWLSRDYGVETRAPGW